MRSYVRELETTLINWKPTNKCTPQTNGGELVEANENYRQIRQCCL